MRLIFQAQSPLACRSSLALQTPQTRSHAARSQARQADLGLAQTPANEHWGFSLPLPRRPSAMQAQLLAQLPPPLVAEAKPNSSLPTEAPANKPAAQAAVDASPAAQSKVGSLGECSAELFATQYVVQGLQNLQAGAKVLVLADGKESKSAATLAMDYSNLDIYSADYNFKDQLEKIDFMGIGYYRIKVDHRLRLDSGVIGSSQLKFNRILMIKGLCDHYEWRDRNGSDAGPVGCAGIALSAPGVSSLLASIAPLMADQSRFALHGDINFMDYQSDHQALSPPVQKAIIAGVGRFNIACGHQMASVWVGDTGLVIAGEKLQSLTEQQHAQLKPLVDDYFSQDRRVVCEKYPS